MIADERLTAAQQTAAIDRVGDSLALRSGAGCGKTLVLARRFVELLLACEDPAEAVGRFVALTFTEKAALEMSRRVREMVAAAAAAAAEPQRSTLRRWLEELPEARISTIHSFCASLLRAHAVEAGIDPDFAVCADELLAQRLVAEAAEQALLDAIERGRDDAAELVAGASFEAVVGWIGRLVAQRTACDLAACADANRTLAGWRAMARAQGRAALAELAADAHLAAEAAALADRPCDDDRDRLAVFRDEQLGVIRQILSAGADASAELFAGLNDRPGNIGSPANWGGADELQPFRGRLRALIAAVREFALFAEEVGQADRRAAEMLAALARLTGEALSLYDAEKRRRGLLDFTDLLVHAGRLLASSDAARRVIGRQIDQLLIDECQDTDAFQIDLLGRLIGCAEGGAPPPGRLFVVGDAKQSIYRFRGAQVEAFGELCGRLGASGQEYLETSFRTHEAGIAFVNHLFSELMGPDYVPIRAARQVEVPRPSVEVLLATGADGEAVRDAESATAAQAAATAERIRQMLDGREELVWDADAERWRAVRPGDVAILFARMTKSLDYERELQRRDVPYYVVAGTGFFQQQEVFDVLNALRAVDNPRDDVALLGALRSGLFALDDNALMHLAEACEPPYFATLAWADLSDRLDADRREAVAFAAELLGRLHRQKDAVGIDVLLERLLAETGYEAALLAQRLGRRMVGNVRRVVDLARQAAAEGVSLGDFLAEVQELILNESRYEQAAVAGEAEDVVRLLTIHKAKGLEFPVVIVPDLNAGRRGHADPLLPRTDWGLTFRYTGDADDEPPLSYRLAKAREDADQRAEDVRKLYVAATRHRDHLVFVGADWRGKGDRLRSAGSYIALMDDALGLSKAATGAQGQISYGGGRFAARVRRVTPGEPARRHRAEPPGRRLLDAAQSGADLTARIGRQAGRAPAPARLGPLPARVGQVGVGVTALCDFDRCPMLYRWRHELCIPRQYEARAPAASDGEKPARSAGLDAATLGTLYHRCMERVAFARPQPAAALVGQAADEMDLSDTIDRQGVAAELATMLAAFRRQPLWDELAAASEVFRELDFVMDCPPATLRGQIDLLARGPDGSWHVVDYKSDRVGREGVAAHAAPYELQMLLYAAAAARHLGRPPATARLYFLRPAETVAIEMQADAVGRVEARAAALAERLIAARRSGDYAAARSDACRSCPFAELCAAAGAGGA